MCIHVCVQVCVCTWLYIAIKARGQTQLLVLRHHTPFFFGPGFLVYLELSKKARLVSPSRNQSAACQLTGPSIVSPSWAGSCLPSNSRLDCHSGSPAVLNSMVSVATLGKLSCEEHCQRGCYLNDNTERLHFIQDCSRQPALSSGDLGPAEEMKKTQHCLQRLTLKYFGHMYIYAFVLIFGTEILVAQINLNLSCRLWTTLFLILLPLPGAGMTGVHPPLTPMASF